jgi:predicted ATPase
LKRRWDLNIEKFGKIKKATISMNKFMIFSGSNNSGKSYVSMLIWRILSITNLGKDCFAELNHKTSYKNCEKLFINSKGKLLINNDSSKCFIEFINDIFDLKKHELVQSIFNYDVEIDKLYVSNFNISDDLIIELKDDWIRIISGISVLDKTFSKRDDNQMMFIKILSLSWYMLLNDFESKSKTIYLPASRTGFMLSFKHLIRNIMDKEFTLEKKNIDYGDLLTQPIIQFLIDLTRFRNSKKDIHNYEDISEFIETNILKGSIEIDESVVPDYSFITNNNLKLPLHITSSLVSELTPLILYLKSYFLDFESIIIEEPESHLHLEMQLLIARAIIRLINKGMFVCITTHSDTIIQQINNLISLFYEKNNEKIKEIMRINGYNESDLLDYEKVAAYEFIEEHDGIAVKKLITNNTGVEVRNFNSVLTTTATTTMSILEATIPYDED